MTWIIGLLAFVLWLAFYAIPKRLITWEMCLAPLVFVCVTVGLVLVMGLRSPKPTPPPPPAVVSEFSLAHYQPAFFTTDFTIKNDSNAVLLDTNLDLQFRREDGEIISIKRFWARWDVNEIKTVPVPNGSYEQASARGTSNRWGKPIEIDLVWRITKKPQ